MAALLIKPRYHGYIVISDRTPYCNRNSQLKVKGNFKTLYHYMYVYMYVAFEGHARCEVNATIIYYAIMF